MRGKGPMDDIGALANRITDITPPTDIERPYKRIRLCESYNIEASNTVDWMETDETEETSMEEDMFETYALILLVFILIMQAIETSISIVNM